MEFQGTLKIEEKTWISRKALSSEKNIKYSNIESGIPVKILPSSTVILCYLKGNESYFKSFKNESFKDVLELYKTMGKDIPKDLTDTCKFNA